MEFFITPGITRTTVIEVPIIEDPLYYKPDTTNCQVPSVSTKGGGGNSTADYSYHVREGVSVTKTSFMDRLWILWTQFCELYHTKASNMMLMLNIDFQTVWFTAQPLRSIQSGLNKCKTQNIENCETKRNSKITFDFYCNIFSMLVHCASQLTHQQHLCKKVNFSGSMF